MAAEDETINQIIEELEMLSEHIKKYSTGTFPCFYLQLHSVLKIQDILSLKLADIYMCEGGDIHVKKDIFINGVMVRLSDDERMNLAWYALQRIPVRRTNASVLQDYLCVNKQSKPLQKQVYRKMLERMSSELGLSRIYNAGYLRSLHGYLEIYYGRKTVDEMARAYGVTRYYMLSRMFRNLTIEYSQQVLNEVACVSEEERMKNDSISRHN